MESVLSGMFAGIETAVEREALAVRDYMYSERFQLDLIAARHRGDPIAHCAAVGEYFTQRSHRELDALLLDRDRVRLRSAALRFGVDLSDWQVEALLLAHRPADNFRNVATIRSWGRAPIRHIY